VPIGLTDEGKRGCQHFLVERGKSLCMVAAIVKFVKLENIFEFDREFCEARPLSPDIFENTFRSVQSRLGV
jgi:hypothetical protein